MLSPKEARQEFKKAIQRAFGDVVAQRKGQLESAAAEIDCRRQSLEQYAAISKPATPGADVLLMAMLYWGLKITIEEKGAREGERHRWECGLMPDRAPTRANRSPVQLELPLHQAIKDLDEQNLEVKILKRGIGRIELGLEISFLQRLA